MFNKQKQCADITDKKFHGFLAAKTTYDSETVVTESMIDTIRIGCKITAINGVLTSTLTQDEIQGIFSTRVNRIHPTVTAYVQDDTAYDAVQYCTMLDELTQFTICALCGEEGPPKGSVHINNCYELLKKTNIKDLFNAYTECLNNSSSSDQEYAREIQYYLPDGLLRGILPFHFFLST